MAKKIWTVDPIDAGWRKIVCHLAML